MNGKNVSQAHPGPVDVVARPEAPRGYRLTNGGGKNLERMRDIAAGLGAKATAAEGRALARLYFKSEARALARIGDEEEQEG